MRPYPGVRQEGRQGARSGERLEKLGDSHRKHIGRKEGLETRTLRIYSQSKSWVIKAAASRYGWLEGPPPRRESLQVPMGLPGGLPERGNPTRMARPQGKQGDVAQTKTSKKGPQDLTHPHKYPQKAARREAYLLPLKASFPLATGLFSPLLPLLTFPAGLLPSLDTSYSEPGSLCPETSRCRSLSRNPQSLPDNDIVRATTTALIVPRLSANLLCSREEKAVLECSQSQQLPSQHQTSSWAWQAFALAVKNSGARGEGR